MDAGQNLYTKLQDLLRDDQQVSLQILLLDPFSSASRLRSVAEQGWSVNYYEGQLYSDLVASVRSLQDLVRRAEQKDRFALEARFYNVHPPFYMFASSSALFLEPYHVGRLVEDPPCIGGFVPVLKFSAASSTYERASKHFDYIWESKAPRSQTDNREPDSWTDGEFLVTRTLEEVAADMDQRSIEQHAI